MPKKAKGALRPYQKTLIAEILPALAAHGSVVMQLPTGGGKTHIATEVAHRAIGDGKRVWFVCHRKEIQQQTSDAFEAAGVSHGIVKAGAEVEPEWQVQICSVMALARRLDRLPPPDLMIWDECHHVVARVWSELKAKFGEAHHLGLTATPARLDGTGLGREFKHILCGPDTRTLIDDGHLSEYRLFGPTIPDMRQVRTKLGDYDKGDVEREMTKPVLVGDVVDHYQRLAPGARAIAFAISVKASQAVVERFLAAGIAAQHVDAKTPPAEREAAIEALRTGAIKVLSNVQLFDEGFDCPAIDAVILLRPTKSLAMYRQMIGRGLRTYPGKAATVILDHSGLVHEHGLPDEPIMWSLEGFSRPPVAGEDGEGRARLRRCPECSAIHAWAAECVECGHEYVTEDRTIEEVYGHLRAVSPSNFPDGCETQKAFGTRVGYSGVRIGQLLKEGMPSGPLASVKIVDALEWLAQRQLGVKPEYGKHEGYETQREFAARIGEVSTFVSSLRVRGLPHIEGKGIPVLQALEWLEQNPVRMRRRVADDSGLESRSAFQKRVDLSLYVLNRAIKAGLPINSDNNIPIKEAMAWLDKNPVRRSFRKSSSGDFWTAAQFCKEIGVNTEMFLRMKNAGLPIRSDQRLDIAAATNWVKNNYIKVEPRKRRLVSS